MIKPEYHDWSTAEIFACLQNNKEISNKNKFEQWKNQRDQMIKMLEEFFEVLPTE